MSEIKPTTTEEILKPLQAVEESMKERYKTILGIDADYSPESLRALDYAIYHRFSPEVRKEPMFATILLLGYYFGETLIRNIPNGKWVDEVVQHPLLVIIEFQHGNGLTSQISPFQRIVNFFQDSENQLYALYLGLKKATEGEVNFEKMNTLIPLGDGYEMRTRGGYLVD